MLCFYFCLFYDILKFPFWLILSFICCSKVCCLIATHLWLFLHFMISLFHTIVLGKDIWYDFNLLQFANSCFVPYNDLSWRMFHFILENNLYSAAAGWNVLYMTVSSIWSKVWFKSNIALFTFCLDDLWIVENRVLNSYYYYIVVYFSLQIC